MSTQNPGKPPEYPKKKPVTDLQPLRDECHDLIAINRIDSAQLEPAAFTPERPAKIRRNAETEDLLNGMIAEMHYFMRALVLPSACDTIDASRRIDFINVAGGLALRGAQVADAVAKLRSAMPASEAERGQFIEAIARVS
jgi:hypothetical protein